MRKRLFTHRHAALVAATLFAAALAASSCAHAPRPVTPAAPALAASQASVKVEITVKPKKLCKITFDANGGSTSSTGKSLYEGSMIGTLPAATKSGSTFGGWYTAKSGGTRISAETKVPSANSKTYYAHWSKAQVQGPPAPKDLKVNINTAGSSQLQKIKGVGPKLADAIVAYRNAHGPFGSPDDLLNVKGIGKAKLDKMRPQIIV